MNKLVLDFKLKRTGKERTFFYVPVGSSMIDVKVYE